MPTTVHKKQLLSTSIMYNETHDKIYIAINSITSIVVNEFHQYSYASLLYQCTELPEDSERVDLCAVPIKKRNIIMYSL